MAFGSVSAIAPLWSAQIFHMAMWWSAILGIHFHFFFPVRFEFKYKKSALISIYLVGILGTLVDIIGGANIDYIHPEIYELRRLWIVGSILLVILLLIFSYRENWQKQVKHQIRLIVLGSSLCLVAFASLTLIPDILFNDYIVNYSISLLFLGVIPITYAHSILQYRLIELDRYINRNFVRLLNSLLLISACFIVYAIIRQIVPTSSELIGIPTTVIISIMLYEYVAAFTKRLFYREGYDYKSTVQQITHYINQAIDIDTLASTSIQRLREVLLIDDFCLLLQTVDGVQVFSSSSTVADYRGILNTNEELWLLIEEISAPVDLYKLEDFLSDIQHSSLKEKIPNYNSIVFWMPILANGESHGLLGIGRKLGRDIPNRYDREILETVNRHFALRFSNLRLIDELKHRTYETIQLHHQALNAREEERKRVARELHDQIIQSLVGLNYHLSQFRNNLPSEEKVSLEKVQYEVRAIISDLRRICIDLRPPALDNLGLIAAVRSRLSEIEQQSSFQINLEIEGETNYEIPEQIALCTYRTLQEVLINIKKHALANQVDIRLYFTEQEIKLSVRDDGCGFVVPPYLGRLIKEGHFGLIGLREHVETLNGTLVINSQLGLGTSIDVVLPTAKLVKPAQILG